MFKIRCIVVLSCLLASFAFTARAEKAPVRIAILSIDPAQIATFSRWSSRFASSYPDHRIEIDYFSDAHYKANIEDWLEQGTYDILYWQAGNRLTSVVERNLVTPLSSLVDRKTLSESLPASARSQVSYHGQIQALPFAQYGWGFYYNKTLFSEMGLSAPSNWAEFIALCHTLKKNGITPLIQANQENWPTLAWFDYLSLDLGGTQGRKALLANRGKDYPHFALLSKRLRDLFENDFFFAPEHAWPWQHTLPAIVRKQAAMTLSGQFAESIINNAMTDHIGFFPFPMSHEQGAEISPMEVFMVANASNNKTQAATFLRFMLEPWVQVSMAIELGWLPTNLQSLPLTGLSERQRDSAQHLSKTTARIQFFDREAPQEHADRLATAFLSGMVSRSSESAMDVLTHPRPLKPLPEPTTAMENRLHFATLKGHKGSFLASSILRAVYKEVGYNISITRFPSTQAALKSYEQGLDGELARAEAFQAMAEGLIRVPEPLVTATFALVSHERACHSSAKPKKVGTSSDAMMAQKWAASQGIQLEQYDDEHLMWEAFTEGKIPHVISMYAGIEEHRETAPIGCDQTIASLPVYHYLKREHHDLVEQVNKALLAYKKSPEYQANLQRFGVKNSE